MTIKRYHQIVCDSCYNTIDNVEPGVKLTYKDIRSRGIIISKGKHFCDLVCKEDFAKKGVGE